MIKAYFLSDLHLKDISESNSQKLLLFLRSLAENPKSASHLFLVGDIFDLWIHNHSYFVEKFEEIVNAIKAVVAQGIEVHYFEGNHDLYLSKFWQQEVGVRVHDGPVYFTLGKLRVRVEHGDVMNPEDVGYLRLRATLRSAPLKFIAEHLPGVLVSWIGERMSMASRQYTSNQKNPGNEKIKNFMHAYSQKVITEGLFDFHIHGHTHHRDVFEFGFDGKTIQSINLGSWFDTPQVFELTEDGFQFVSLT